MKRTDLLRGDVWLVDFDPTTGAEIRKTRPAVIMSLDSIGRLPVRIVVPFTDWKPHYTNHAWLTYIQAGSVTGLSKDSGADGYQVKSVSEDRFRQRLGSLTAARNRQQTGGEHHLLC